MYRLLNACGADILGYPEGRKSPKYALSAIRPIGISQSGRGLRSELDIGLLMVPKTP